MVNDIVASKNLNNAEYRYRYAAKQKPLDS